MAIDRHTNGGVIFAGARSYRAWDRGPTIRFVEEGRGPPSVDHANFLEAECGSGSTCLVAGHVFGGILDVLVGLHDFRHCLILGAFGLLALVVGGVPDRFLHLAGGFLGLVADLVSDIHEKNSFDGLLGNCLFVPLATPQIARGVASGTSGSATALPTFGAAGCTAWGPRREADADMY